MIRNNNNLSPIPFYRSLAEQDFRKWYAYGGMYPHRVSGSNLIPFFFVYGDPISSITSIKFYKACCSEEEIFGAGAYNLDFSSAFSLTGDGDDSGFGATLITKCGILNADDGSYGIVYFTAPTMSLGLPKGLYYMVFELELEDGDTAYRYSDVFLVESDADLQRDCISVKWYDEEDLEFTDGLIPYAHTAGSKYYGNKVFLDTTIGMPEYEFTEEGEERDGRFFPIKQISEKTYKFTFIAPEFLCDAMRTIRMSDVIVITDQYDNEYDVEQFEMEVSWLEGGHLAEVQCSFQTDTVVKKIGKAYGTIRPR